MSTNGRNDLLDEDEMLGAEAEAIWGRADHRPQHVSGIALSGGGVRAAIVALGVLQSLSEHGLLSKFSYISTVSGGGYIGSALTWFWSKHRVKEERLPSDRSCFGCGKSDFPFQDSDPGRLSTHPKQYEQLTLQEKAIKNLTFLRNHGSYLTSGDGVGITAMIVAVFRTILVSLLVWVPLLIGIFVIVEVINGAASAALSQYCNSAEPSFLCTNPYPVIAKHPIYLLPLGMGLALIALFGVGVVTLSLFTPAIKEDTPAKIPQRIKQGIPYVLTGVILAVFSIVYFTQFGVQPETGAICVLLFLIAARLIVTGTAKLSVANASYFLRRSFDRWAHAFLPLTFACLFTGSMPLIFYSDPQTTAGSGQSSIVWFFTGPVGGVVTLVSGIGTALYGYYVKAKSILPGFASRMLAIGSSILFLAGLLWCSFALAQRIYYVNNNDFAVMAALSFFLIALTLGTFSSVNTTGLHRFYRDRLMETFMPMSVSINAGVAKQSDVADTFSIANMWDGPSDHGVRPYQLINAHAILIGDEDPKIALRGGENFVMSAAVVGSSATGWMKTKEYLKANGPLTLASAMAASGAAANANAGYIGTGITRLRSVSAVMSTLNIRLGLWVSNPRVIAKCGQTRRPRLVATYFGTALTSAILRSGNDRNSKFVELSDGGHFENLGLYELVRRKATVILAVDAEQDGAINLSSLVSSANRIKEDFGTTIRFLESRGPELLLGQESLQYPGGVKIAKSPYIVGDIHYNDKNNSRGVLIYIKATMIGGLDFATDGYRASNPDFPHQSTVDQFFDPEQFEAYRDLGRKSCSLAIKDLGFCEGPTRDDILTKYGFEIDRS